MTLAWPPRSRVAALLLLAAALTATLGTEALPPDRTLTQYGLAAWTTDQGLPQNSVQAIAQSADGYLWMGTQEGLVRFDGVRFQLYDKSTTPAFASNNVTALCAPAPGLLWIGTDAGLIRMEGSSFVRFARKDGLSGEGIRWLMAARDGALWIGTSDGGAARFRGGRFRCFGTADGLPDKGVQCILEARDGTLWFATLAGLCRYSGGVFTAETDPSGPGRARVYCLAEDADGTLWAGTEGAWLYSYAHGRFRHWTERDGLPNRMVYALLADREGSLWVGTYGSGLLRLQNGRFERLSSQNGLSNDVVISLFEDREGDLWAGTVGGGVNRLTGGPFIPFGTAEGLPDNMVSCLLQDGKGTLWVGSYGAGLCRIDSGRVTRITTNNGLLDDKVYSLMLAPDGSLWVGTGSGAQRLAGGPKLTLTEREGLPNPSVYAMAATRDGSLWFGTGHGLARFADGRMTVYDQPGGILDTAVVALLGARDGSLWAGSYKGLAHFAGGGFTTFTTASGLPQRQVFSLFEDAGGGLWAGTYGGGLAYFRAGRWWSVTSARGLFDDVVYSIVPDGEGRLWMSCNKGVYCATLAGLRSAAEGVSPRVECRAFGRADGMRSNECNGGTQPAAWRDREGRLWFPTVKGLVSVDPLRACAPPPVVPARVEEALYDRRPLPMDSHRADVPPGKGELEFRYTAMTLASSRRVRFRYRLEGFQEGWVEAGTRREAFFTNIPPGSYVFRVMAAAPGGTWGEGGSSFSLRIRPHFYQTWAFLVLCLAGTFLLAGGLYLARIGRLKARERELVALVAARTRSLQEEKERTEQALELVRAQERKLQEMDQVKTRFFANVSHEFRTPLTLILGPLEDTLGGAYGALGKEAREALSLVLRNGRRLLHLINELLDISKLEAGRLELRTRETDLAAFLANVVHSFTPLAERQGITLRYLPAGGPYPVYLDAEKMEKVLCNLLSNAFKFTPRGGFVSVALEPADDPRRGPMARVTVEDSGPGIPSEDLPHVFERFYQSGRPSDRSQGGSGIGLALARELAVLHGGTLTASSEPGAGARFDLLLPLGRGHLKDEQIVPSGEAAEESRSRIPAGLPEPEPPEPAEKPEAAVPEGSAETVLIAEDNGEVRAYIRSVLARRYRVLEAGDGEQALEMARREPPDLVISDVMMPRMDGYELCRALRRDPRLDHVPCMLLTAKASQDSKVEGLEAGADDYLPKPFDSKELMARARNLIRIRQQERLLKSFNEELEKKVREQLVQIAKDRRLTKYFPQKLVEKVLLSEEDVELGSERRLVTVFFTDLAGFTALTEHTEPEEITALLNHYLTEMVEAIRLHGGTLARFMGDGILGFFGAFEEMEPAEQALRAVRMALAMQARTAELGRLWQERGMGASLMLRVGIHQDYLTVGNFGAPEHMEYTAVGRGINLAKRLETACTPGRILVSGRIRSLTLREFPYGPLEERSFKGVSAPVAVSELDPAAVKPPPTGSP